jgi:hypothetical protein
MVNDTPDVFLDIETAGDDHRSNPPSVSLWQQTSHIVYQPRAVRIVATNQRNTLRARPHNVRHMCLNLCLQISSPPLAPRTG